MELLVDQLVEDNEESSEDREQGLHREELVGVELEGVGWEVELLVACHRLVGGCRGLSLVLLAGELLPFLDPAGLVLHVVVHEFWVLEGVLRESAPFNRMRASILGCPMSLERVNFMVCLG